MASLSSRQAIKLATGASVPLLFYGTAWKDYRTVGLVIQAVQAGFRGIDTDSQIKHYREDLVGEAIKRLHAEYGVEREQLFIQTKFTSADWQDPQHTPYDRDARLAEQVRQSFTKSLENLCTNYVDSLVMHGPAYSHSATMEVWRTFEELHSQGLVKQLGLTRQHDVRQLAKIYEEATVKPTLVQNSFSAKTQYDTEVRGFCEKNAVVYLSIANPRTFKSRTMHGLANKKGVSYDQLFFRFMLDLGVAAMIGTSNEAHMRADLAVLGIPALSTSEVQAIKREIGIE